MSSQYAAILEKIKEIPILDVHSHISTDHPHARDISDILFYHFLRREAYSAGLPDDDYLVSSAPLSDRISAFFSILPKIENTSTFWCVRKILKDLYHVPEGEIHYGNWKDIQETIKEKEKDPEWPKKVFEQARIRHSLICENHWDPESLNRNSFLSPLYEDLYLFHFDPSRDQSLIDLIQKENGQLPATAASFAEVVFAFFQSKADQGIRYFTSFISSAFSLLKASPEKIEATYQKQLLGHNLDPEEKNVLFTWLFYTYLEAMQQVKSPAQFVMGARWARPGMRYGESYVWTNHQLTLDLMSVFRDFPQVRMSLMFAALPLAHELTILARMLPNVSLLGFWWHTLFPTVIEQLIAERLESLPINKWIAIATDAYSVEWAYGKVSLVLQCLAKVLSKKMAEEYLTEQKALWIARKLLYENPQEIYGLSSTPENDG